MFKVACLVIAALTHASFASAGVLIDCSNSSLISPFSGLLISSAGFFFRGPRRKSPLLYFKESELETGKPFLLLKKIYPELSDDMAKKLEIKIIEKNQKILSNQKIKELIFEEKELKDTLFGLSDSNPELYKNLINDFNKKTI